MPSVSTSSHLSPFNADRPLWGAISRRFLRAALCTGRLPQEARSTGQPCIHPTTANRCGRRISWLCWPAALCPPIPATGARRHASIHIRPQRRLRPGSFAQFLSLTADVYIRVRVLSARWRATALCATVRCSSSHSGQGGVSRVRAVCYRMRSSRFHDS